MQTWNEQFDLLVKSRTPLILVRSREEERLETLVKESTKRLSNFRLATWDYVEGLTGILNSEGIGARQPMAILQWLQNVDPSLPTILLAKDFHRFTEDAGIARMLRNLSSEFRKKPHTIVLCSSDWSPSSNLDDTLTILDLPLPQENELKTLLRNIATASNSDLNKETLEELTHACSGLSEVRVRQVAAKALAQRGKLSKEDISEVLEEKRQAVARSEVLEYFETKASPSDIGGLDALKSWLDQRHEAFSDEARDFGLPLPRGVLLIGPQGTGKSLTAKAIAHSWSMPLLRLDVGRLFAGLVGASEAKTRETIQYAESMAPCVLWIDEIDKGFGGDARSDGGTSQRVLANLLTWMAEKQSAVFVVATANGIDRMPGELLRKGRFDEIFLLDLPTQSERYKILELHISHRRPNLSLPIETVVDRTQGFSGAELEQTVIEAMHHAFSERRELMETDLILAATQLIPLSKTAKEQLDFLKDWASSGRARPASLNIH
ncbi:MULTISPECIES: AAA family ATPase [unclassified Prochlorococcus]|uniref:AAA family ATPase n=1 Tax=unclassified Prochlorococcus TaxID=2627481 RepID=UPI000533BB61|nr:MULTISPECIES: AAA family ATPase [unclassified Prochlorococcus]KGG16367.1 ATPase of the AAA+ family [Prochlorococcus sp. MIT 0603]KGG17899.1 ATPase of the AAA+ family [Prochlorococcus sp. MIT 0602]